MKTNQKNTQEVIDKLLKIQKRLTGQDMTIEEIMSKFNSEHRDKRRPIKYPLSVPGGVTFSEKPLKTNKSYEFRKNNNGYELAFGNFEETPEGTDFFIIGEEIDRFIDDFIKFCDEAFPE